MTDYSKIIAEDTETLRRMQAKTECPHCAELKAQTAAMLEKAASINEEYERRICEDFNSLDGTELRVHQQIRALIPADHAAALAERDAKLLRNWSEDLSVQGWRSPGDVAERVRQAVPKFSILDALEALEYAAEGRTNSVKPDLLANHLNKLAAHRAAAGAPDGK